MRTLPRGTVARIRECDRLGDPHPLAGERVVVVAEVPPHEGDDEVRALVQVARSRAAEAYEPLARSVQLRGEQIVEAMSIGGFLFAGFVREELEPLDEPPTCPRCGACCSGVRRLTGAAVMFLHDDTGHALEI